MSNPRKSTIQVQGSAITVLSKQQGDYISLTDMVRHFEGGGALIEQWLKNKDTVLFLGVWERIHNPDFNSLEFEGIRNEAGRNSFFLSAKSWIDRTRAKGLSASAGRYGGTYAHKDIAFEFGSWLSPEFKLYLIKEFQRLKDDENRRLSLAWNLNRTLSKLEGNMRDYATIEQLLVLANIEGMNAGRITIAEMTEERVARCGPGRRGDFTYCAPEKRTRRFFITLVRHPRLWRQFTRLEAGVAFGVIRGEHRANGVFKPGGVVKAFLKCGFGFGAALVLALACLGQTAAGQAPSGTGGIAAEANSQAGPQILTLPNGLKFQFAGVTYDTKDVPPSLEAELLNSLPGKLENLAQRYVGKNTSQWNAHRKFDTPRFFVWFQLLGTNAPVSGAPQTLAARLTDQAGMEAGVSGFAAFAGSAVWSFADFPVFPRRSRVIQCALYPFGGSGNPASPFGRNPAGAFTTISFPNPFCRDFPQWKPEPVPAVKMAGDLEVRLDNFTAGGQLGGTTIVKADGSRRLFYPPALKGEDTVTAFDISLSSPRGTNELWVLHSAELSDATGNVLSSKAFMSSRFSFVGLTPPPQSGRTAYSESIPGTLWPDEAAWRLKLELKRAVGFAPEEIVTFKNVPVPAVGATNTSAITQTVGGIQIVLAKFERKPNITINALGMYSMASRILVELPGKPPGVAVDFLGVTTDVGTVEQYGRSGDDFSYGLLLKSIPANAKTMDLSWVVQKTRSVEFLVKPPNSK